MDKDYDLNSDTFVETARIKLEKHNIKLNEQRKAEERKIEHKVKIAWYALVAFISIITIPIVIYSAKILEIVFRLK